MKIKIKYEILKAYCKSFLRAFEYICKSRTGKVITEGIPHHTVVLLTGSKTKRGKKVFEEHKNYSKLPLYVTAKKQT